MKRIIALVCLFALVMVGCAKEESTEQEQTTQATTTAEVTYEVPEQVVQAQVSPLVGHWEATLDKGQYAALLYYLQTGGDEEYAMTWLGFMQDVTYPLTVTIEINEDNTYLYTIHPDSDGAGLEEFSVSLYNGMVSYFANINNSSLEEAKDYMADHETALWDINSNIKELNMDKLFINPETNAGTWEQNDKGLVLSGWCTVQFEEKDGVMTWLTCDDMQTEENLPLTFTKQ